MCHVMGVRREEIYGLKFTKVVISEVESKDFLRGLYLEKQINTGVAA